MEREQVWKRVGITLRLLEDSILVEPGNRIDSLGQQSVRLADHIIIFFELAPSEVFRMALRTDRDHFLSLFLKTPFIQPGHIGCLDDIQPSRRVSLRVKNPQGLKNFGLIGCPLRVLRKG
jgi:hypothetical protein